TVFTDRYREALAELMATTEVRTVLSIGSAVDNTNLARQGHELGKKVILEHYGRGCMVIWRDGMIEKAVESACRVCDLSAKPCFIPKIFLVHEASFERFMSALLARLPQHSITVEADPINGVLSPTANLPGFLTALQEARQVGE